MAVLTSLFHTLMPKNVETVMFTVMKLTNLDLLQPDLVWERIYTPQFETEPLNIRYMEAGYDTADFIMGLGSLFFVFCIINVTFLLKLLGYLALCLM